MMALAHASHAWRLGDLLADLVELDGVCASLLERQVTEVTHDSRTLVPGALFMALRGRRVHGLAFAEEAGRRGAIAILGEIDESWSRADILDLGGRLGVPAIPVAHLSGRLSAIADRFHGAPSARLEVIGVAGEHGRTSVGHLLAQALDAEQASATIGRLGIGFPGDLHDSQTGLDALTLQWMLNRLADQGAKSVTLELGLDPVALSHVAAVRLTHLVLAGALDPASIDGASLLMGRASPVWGVLNLDDPLSASMLASCPAGVRLAGYSQRPEVQAPSRCELLIQARAIETRPCGLRLDVVCRGDEGAERAELDAPLLGRFNAANLLAVLAVMRSRGLSLERSARALSRVRAVPGRMEPFGGDGAPLVVVDSSRTPESLERALTELRAHVDGRLMGVLGGDGESEPHEHSRLGAVAERLCDSLILTDGNPRGAAGEAIVANILAGLGEPRRVRVERRRGQAIRLAIALAGLGEAVLVAGKGHETVQDMGELKLHFSDRAQVVEALREWREGHH